MSLQNHIRINGQYTRSVNLERDHDSGNTVASYIPTSRSKRLLKRINQSLDIETQPRAWSLIGPYGSGKSSFSVFLSHLFSNPETETAQQAFQVLNENNVEQAKDFQEHTNDTAGYLKVLISGSPEPLGKRILSGLHKTALDFYAERKGRTPSIINKLEAAISSNNSTSEIVKLFKQLQSDITKIQGKRPAGILLIIDELGKFLEYEARHYGANDVFLLQELAELACKGHECNLLMFVLLHQSFEQYAKGLGETLKNEWAKVQGRFEEVPFLESTEQTLKVVAKALVNNYSADEFKGTADKISQLVSTLNQQKALPSILEEGDAQKLFKSCYPLHPISALILPHLCQKLAQNERTLFNFLGSTEEHGFIHTIENLTLGEYITPDVIFDYFITNQSSVVSDHLTHRRWAEVVTAVDRLGSVEPLTIQVLKTIGLFNIINSKGNFKASEALLNTLSNSLKVKLALAELTKKSIINYRSFNSEFRVWQGSDFDLEDALQEQLSLLGNFSLSEELNATQILKPLVARKYTVENGTLRYFLPLFTDAQSYKAETKNESNNPRIIFFLAYGQDDVKLFESKVRKSFSKSDIVVLCRNSTQLKEAFAEVIALRKIELESQALKEDPVAKREYFDRRNAAESIALQLIKSYELEPQDSEWFFLAEQQTVTNRRDLQTILSTTLNKIYNKSPAFHNELINRDKPSSQANAGRNKLLAAMLEKVEFPLLDIEKFPPEKSMYLSILKTHGLHVPVIKTVTIDGKSIKKEVWELSAPPKNSTLNDVWKRINQFFDTTKEGNAKSFNELDEVLMAAPYGVKAGLLPILYVHALLVNTHELALFEEGVFIPALSPEAVERFVKAPHFFKVEKFKIEGVKASLFASYKKALFSSDDKVRSLLDIAKPLAKFIGGLEEYTRKTKSEELSNEAHNLLKAFSISKSPQKLLLETLPASLGFNENVFIEKNESSYEEFANKLLLTIAELKHFYKKLIETERKLLCRAFNLNKDMTLEHLRKHLFHYNGLEDYSVDIDGLKAFIKRLTTIKGDDNYWLENLLTFLAAKPPKNWLDADRSKAEFNLSDYSNRIAELDKLRIEHDKNRKHIQGDFDVILLKSLKKGVEPREVAVTVDDEKRESVKSMRNQIEKLLESQKNEFKLVLLAELVDDFLSTLSPKK